MVWVAGSTRESPRNPVNWPESGAQSTFETRAESLYDNYDRVKRIQFDWDHAKSRANLRKHGVSFLEAQSAFADPLARIIADPDHSQDEDRFILLGLSETPRLLVVCHCYRDEDSLIRIISARKANRRETLAYQELNP